MNNANKAFHPFFQSKKPTRQPQEISTEPTPSNSIQNDHIEPLKANQDTTKKPRKAKKTAQNLPPIPRFFCKPESSKKQATQPPLETRQRPVFLSDVIQADEALVAKRKAAAAKAASDHEFSRLDRSIFGDGHITDKTYTSLNLELPEKPQIDLKSMIQHQQTSFFTKGRQLREKRVNRSQSSDMEQDTVMSNRMDTRVEVEGVLDTYFPQWRIFPSCVTFVQSIFNDPPKLNRSNRQWTDKYRPSQVNGLLGARHNYVYLKDWLHQMKVEPLSAPQPTDDQKQVKRTKKKKKKLNMNSYRHEEDGDEDMGLMRGLSLQEEEDDDFVVNPATQKRRVKKEPMRSNILLLVGEHGVGKTATVYTAAEQMEYEVFEINSGSRRSGKDIMSMVGEMTKSHLVAFGVAPPVSAQSLFIERPKPIPTQKRKKLNPTLSSGNYTTSAAKTTKRDTDVTLKSFLRKKEPSTPLPVSAPTTKQSLILLEEVDLLFEEDKGFWTSVIELAQKSKRPIIMTCNDLDQIPLDNLCLQIVLDIKPPPDTELLPYLWLVCYREGFQVDPVDLVCLVGLLGRDIRKLLQTLEMFAGQAIFGNYLGIHQDMDQAEMKLQCMPSETGVDTYRVACEYQDMNMFGEQENQETLESITKALENDSFIDTWLEEKHNILEEMEDITKDQINGYTYLKLDRPSESDDLLRIRELGADTTVLNNQIPRSEVWKQLVSDESSHWVDLCSARVSLAEDYRDLLERILPATIDDQMLMMEYIPHIQMMMMASESPKENHRMRTTRSKRKKTHLSLSEEAIESLNEARPIIDETAYIIQYLQSLKTIHRQ
ncbi:hypothetical protein EDC96DRAFT_521499 [Choanephora cucurbitarum]|nr:hypothetical protein EDC96DRAFT_521499 [Choanephora cucurbitarum]